MTNQPSSVDRIIEAAKDVREFEDRVAALRAALDAEADDPATVQFLQRRLSNRVAILTSRRVVLDSAIKAYQSDRKAEDRNVVNTINLPTTGARA